MMNSGLSTSTNTVVILQENHTFDNYFGTFPGADVTAGESICLPEALSQNVKSVCNALVTPATTRICPHGMGVLPCKVVKI
jgi:phospholipase C